MTENEEMGPKEVKNSQKKKIVRFFFNRELVSAVLQVCFQVDFL